MFAHLSDKVEFSLNTDYSIWEMYNLTVETANEILENDLCAKCKWHKNRGTEKYTALTEYVPSLTFLY